MYEGDLSAVDEKDIPGSGIKLAYLPKSATKSNDEIMAFIETQIDLSMDSWRVLQRTIPNGNDVELVLTVNDESMQKVISWEFKINYM